MAATKIINVSKSDSFEEVFEAFQNTSAEEIILIIPKASKLAKQEAHFVVFKKEADSSDKQISVMTEDPKIEKFAELSGIHVLSGPSSVKKTPKAKPVASLAVEEDTEEEAPQESEVEPESVVDEKVEDTDEEKNNDEEEPEHPIASLTMASVRSNRKNMDDIIEEDMEATVPIKEHSKTVNIGIKKEKVSAKEAGSMDNIEAMWTHQYTEQHEKKLKNRSRRIRLGAKRWPIIIGLVAVLAFGGVAYTVLGSAKISIQPKKENTDFKTNISTSPNFSSVDLKADQIPGQQFSIQKEVSDTFPATGQKTVAQKAHGRIQIFNNNVGQPQRLVATTRFESKDGFVFRIPETITVPGATKTADGKIAPGTMESDVFADKPGPEYNIGPSSFTIPGFKGLLQYTQFAAVSAAAMSGGIIGPSKVVTQDDINKAQAVLEQKLREEIASGLKDKILDLKVIGQDQIKIDPPIVNAKADEAASELKMTLKGSINTVAFRESDLSVFITDHFKDVGGLDEAHSQLTKNYENLSYSDTDSKLSFTLHVTGTVASKLNQEKIAEDIKGMREDQIKSYFNGVPEVGSVKIVLSPFWVKSIPQNPKNIRVIIED